MTGQGQHDTGVRKGQLRPRRSEGMSRSPAYLRLAPAEVFLPVPVRRVFVDACPIVQNLPYNGHHTPHTRTGMTNVSAMDRQARLRSYESGAYLLGVLLPLLSDNVLPQEVLVCDGVPRPTDLQMWVGTDQTHASGHTSDQATRTFTMRCACARIGAGQRGA